MSHNRFSELRLGCPDFTYPETKPDPLNGISGSLFFPDEAIFSGHPRFRSVLMRCHTIYIINITHQMMQNSGTKHQEEEGAKSHH